ncbi:MAG: sterol desaturase family protein [Gammaproteobacteria bacterium]|nr:sterol desaturase family protein [Gammaproteobacteria bacterium]MBU2676598.1 sterol desaturase family protein [Gammaproteobacteria bacterium]NNL50333.1 sterol desaturase family protein [Woeseiaceae bacterium]
MDLIAIAVPFFLLALAIELIVDWRKGSGFYRSNDAINSLSAGILSTTIGYFTKFLPLIAWGYVLQNFSLLDMQPEWFDFSPTGLLLWVIAALAWDFCYYWFHRFSHEISVLWAAHAVHHQSEDYNLSTALRQTSTGFLFGWIFYVPLFLIGFPLGVLITVNAVNLIYQFWVHTQLVRRLGALDRILVTPSNHRVHHAQNERYIDKNYGGMFILWDRFFGTFEDEADDEPVVFGVRKPLANLNPFWANLQVYDYLLFDARKAARWRDKIGIWFRRTGWRPADVERQYPRQQADLTTFRKFDPATTRRQRHYVLAQFLFATVGALWIADAYARQGMEAVLLPCLLLWVQLYTLGLLNEGRSSARRLEWLRLLIAVPILGALMWVNNGEAQQLAGVWIALAVYALISAAWLALVPRSNIEALIH